MTFDVTALSVIVSFISLNCFTKDSTLEMWSNWPVFSHTIIVKFLPYQLSRQSCLLLMNREQFSPHFCCRHAVDQVLNFLLNNSYKKNYLSSAVLFSQAVHSDVVLSVGSGKLPSTTDIRPSAFRRIITLNFQSGKLEPSSFVMCTKSMPSLDVAIFTDFRC